MVQNGTPCCWSHLLRASASLCAGIIGTVFAILLTSHLLACIWYAVGSSDSQDACNEPSNATYAHGLVGEESELIEAACEWSEEQGRFQR